MFEILLSGIGMIVLVSVIIFLFTKLRFINSYNVSIFAFLTIFWVIAALVRQIGVVGTNHTQVDSWVWGLVLAGYQFAQVASRLALGKLSQKMHSRKYPMIFTLLAVLVALVMITASNFALWAIIVGMILTGFFGATFGMQNQYWSENFNIRSVFMTVGIIAILPSLGSLSSNFIISLVRHETGFEDVVLTSDVSTFRWILVGAAVLFTIVIIAYCFFRERKETIKLDNITSNEHSIIANMGIKEIGKLSIQVIMISFAFNVVTSKASYQDVIAADSTYTSIILTFVSIIVAIVTAIYIARYFNAERLIFISHFIMMIGLLFGLIIEYTGSNNKFVEIVYLVILTVGFTLFQNILFGTVLHFDHKNKMLALGIWLTVRSAASGAGQVSSNAINQIGDRSMEIIILSALVLVTFSLAFFAIIRHPKHNIDNLFRIVDKYELKTIASKKTEIWR